MVSWRQTFFFSSFESAESENDLTFSWLAIVFAVQKYLIFGKSVSSICFLYIWYLRMAIISQSKKVVTSQFVFKPTDIALLIGKYYFCNNNQTLRL